VAHRSVAEVLAGFAVLFAAGAFVVYGAVNTGRGSAGGGMRVSAKFENIGALAVGSDVKMAGVTVGRVLATSIDAANYLAVVSFTVQSDIKLPTDSSATISSGGLLGAPSLSLAPGGDEALVKDGGVLTITQSAANLEDLLGKFIFNVGNLADATQKMIKQDGSAVPSVGKP